LDPDLEPDPLVRSGSALKCHGSPSQTLLQAIGQWFAQTHHFNKDPDPLYRDADPQHRLKVD
jgi:hypothetical protein